MKSRGFTLVEIAVVLALLALLIGTLIPINGVRRTAALEAKTEEDLAEAITALTGYAAAHGRVPCPATDAGGVEVVVAGKCAAATGFLPGNTLGILSRDAWGRPLRYAVASKTWRLSAPATVFEYPATTVGGLKLGGLSPAERGTDLTVCFTNTRYRYTKDSAGSCDAGDTPMNVIAIAWSDGADPGVERDNLAAVAAETKLALFMVATGQY